MTFDDLIKEVQGTQCQVRTAETDYLEVVAQNVLLGGVSAVLKKYFGEAFKPEGSDPSAEAITYAEPYGGIMKNQTMYLRQSESASEAAFLWPWGNGTATTLKIIRKKK